MSKRGDARVDPVVHVDARLVATRPAGDYQYMTFAAPGVPDLARPGQFVALTIGGPAPLQTARPAHLLRRSFSLHAVSPAYRSQRSRWPMASMRTWRVAGSSRANAAVMTLS